MTPLLEQFLSESRDVLQGIGEKLMQLEGKPDDTELMVELFRLVHTLKGNSGLFEFPELTRVLHASEDLMDAVRHGRAKYEQALTDRLLDAMDFVGVLCDEIESKGSIGAGHASNSARLAESLRQLIASVETAAADPVTTGPDAALGAEATIASSLLAIAEGVRMQAYRLARQGSVLHWVHYAPAEDCFFQGDDPFFQARGTPDMLWGRVVAREPWPRLATLDAYRCVLDFELLTAAPRAELDEYYRYVPDQVRLVEIEPLWLALPQGDLRAEPEPEAFVVEALALVGAGRSDDLVRLLRPRLEHAKPEEWPSSALRWLLVILEREPENRAALTALVVSLRCQRSPAYDQLCPDSSPASLPSDGQPTTSGSGLSAEEDDVLVGLLEVQREILRLPIVEAWQLGRLDGVVATISRCLRARADGDSLAGLVMAAALARDSASSAPLLRWFDDRSTTARADTPSEARVDADLERPARPRTAPTEPRAEPRAEPNGASPVADADPKFGRRAEDVYSGPKSLKVDQIKIDRLMNLIGEMVVAKNALPYLAARADSVFGTRELSREIMGQYAVINRIAEEMRGSIMEVCMMPVSFVFQRFPRLVRDTSRLLGKDVELVLQGEDTEADKNIIAALADPLVHIIRNSLDHGFELPEARRLAGKPTTGTLTIVARQESDRVVIEVRDDGQGIDPAVIKLKAYQKGLIDEAALEQLSDEEAVNLVFASGLSTREVVSDLSGRGVGMDVVKTAVERVNGTVTLHSEKGKGTRILLSLPLSMAVTNVMIVETDRQIFGVPMESVAETVRVRQSSIHHIKKSPATVLRGRVVPLKAINGLLGLGAPPRANAEDELAVLVLRLGEELVGLLVDDFREAVDIILKPLTGVLAGLSAYSGSALMGDGSVLMVLDPKAILR